MDYNFYVAQSNAKRAADVDLGKFAQEMLDTYKAYFNKNYYGSRAPVDIGHQTILDARNESSNLFKKPSESFHLEILELLKSKHEWLFSGKEYAGLPENIRGAIEEQ
ncbi:MAG: hypothetical protein ACI9UN_000834 [Granulosicoccus sp.]|jgi:hypothetical protein